MQPQKRVLHDSHDGFVALSSDAMLSYCHQRGTLRCRRLGLRHVYVHLVAVEIGIVRRGCHQTETKRVSGHEPDAVRLHPVHVETRLTVEHDDIVVGQVPFDDVSMGIDNMNYFSMVMWRYNKYSSIS